MNYSCVLIENDNKKEFDSVFPATLDIIDSRVAVACVNDEDYILGAISYQVVGSEYVIDWLYVEPDARRQGVGTYLIDQVLRAVANSGEILPVTAQFEFREDDDELHTFFLSCQIMNTSYSHDRYYVSPDEVKASDALHRSIKAKHSIELFFDKPIDEQLKILHMLSIHETYDVTNYEAWKQECVPELCQCIYVNNNLVDLVFMRKLSNGNLELSYLYAKYPRGLLELLASTVAKMEALFPSASLTFDAFSDEYKMLADHLFPKARKTQVYEAEF